jgi:alpha-glucosidase
MLTLYRTALRLRRDVLRREAGPLEWLAAGDGIVAFRRGTDFACVVNMGDAPARVLTDADGAPMLLASGPVADDGVLPADTAAWYAVPSR